MPEPIPSSWSFADRLDAARERAAIMEHDGKLTRRQAEMAACRAYSVSAAELRGSSVERRHGATAKRGDPT